jgi:hypothetical protein
MIRIIEGIYRNGQVDLSERPETTGPAKVAVLFLDQSEEGLASPEDEGLTRDQIIDELVAEMKMGFDLGGRPYEKREDLHDRVNRW